MSSKRYWTFIISTMIVTSGFFFIPDIMTFEVRAAKTLYVGPGGNYSRIQDAIDNATAGDTIRVFNGTYREGVLIEKSINLIGNCSRSTIILPLDEVGIYIKASNTTVRNFKVTHDVNWVSGITVLGAGTNVTIRNCDLSDNGYGIAVQGSTTSSAPENFLIEDCTINNTSTAVKVTSMEGCIMRNVTVSNFTSYAIGSSDSSNCTFSDFKIDSGHWAIVQVSSYNMVYENISLSNCVRGFTFRMSLDTTIRFCNVSTCEEYGVYHLESDDCGYFNNTISDFSYAEYGENWVYPAFYIHSSKSLRIENNSFLGCNIQLEGDAPEWYTHKVENNTVNHKPMRYLVNKTDFMVSQPSGQITIVNSNNVTIKDQVINQTEIALITAFSTKINITNCTFDSAEYGVLINPRVQAHVFDLNITENEFINCTNSAFGITGGRIGRSRIINNTFERSGIGINYYGNDVRYQSYNLIQNNHMKDMVSGIRIDRCSLVDIIDNQIINSSSGGIAVSSGYSNAASRINVSGNLIENCAGGISVTSVNRTVVWNNTIINCTSGIHSNSKEFSTVVMNNNVIAPSLVGLSVSGEGTYLHNNSISMVNSSSSAYGISVDSSRHDIIENNSITGSGHMGIYWRSSRYTAFTNNSLNGSSFYLEYQYWQELTTSDFYGNNSVNGKPVYFNKFSSSFTVPMNISQVILTNCSNAMIDDLTLKNVSTGCYIQSSTNLTVRNIEIESSKIGIEARYSQDIHILNSTFTDNTLSGVYGEDDQRVKITNCSFKECAVMGDGNLGALGSITIIDSVGYDVNNCSMTGSGVYLKGDNYEKNVWIEHTFINNTVNGRPLVHKKNCDEVELEGNDAGQIILTDCDNLQVSDMNLSRSSMGLLVRYPSRIRIKNVTSTNNIYGIQIISRDYNVNYTSIENCTLSGNYNSGLEISALHPSRISDISVLNNECENNNYGITIGGIIDSLKIENNTCVNNSRYGLMVGTSTLSYSSINLIRNNILKDNGVGLRVGGDGYVISNNSIDNNREYGFYIWLSDHVEILSNSICKNGWYGIFLEECEHFEISGSRLNSNGKNGIRVEESKYIDINNNTINYNSLEGVFLWFNAYYCNVSFNNISCNHHNGLTSHSEYPYVYRNTFFRNSGYGIYEGGKYGSYTFNYFIDNNYGERQNFCEGYGSSTSTILKNFYSDHQAPDIDGNGIVDIPYLSNAYVDLYPMIFGFPYLNDPGELVLTEDEDFSYQVTFWNYEGNFNWTFRSDVDFLTYSTNGWIIGIPDNSDVGEWWINATLHYRSNQTRSMNFTLNVSNVNDLPSINSVPRTLIYEDEIYSEKVNFTDVDASDRHIWTMRTNGSFLTLDQNGTISGIPQNDDIGSYWVNISVFDIENETDFINYTLRVNNTNDDPVLVGNTSTFIRETQSYYVDYNATDVDPTNDVLTFSLRTNASFLNIDPNTGILSGTTTHSSLGIYWVNVSVSDGIGGLDWDNFTLTVYKLNSLPVIYTSDVWVATEDTEYRVDYDANDPDSQDVFTWYLETNATFLSINSSTGILSGIPSNSDVGTFWVNVSVTDNDLGWDWSNFTISVSNVNDDPTITTVNVIICQEDALYSIDYNASDIDPTGDPLTWSMLTNATFLSIVPSTGILSGTPRNSDVGSFWVNVSVSDGNGGTAWTNFTLSVSNTNDPPSITTSNTITAVEDSLYTVDYNATDPDPTGDTFTWLLTTNANFLSIDRNTGVLSGTPSDSDVGTKWVNVSVSDGNGGVSWNHFTLTVLNINDDPRITTDDTIATLEDRPYSVDYDGIDPDPAGEGDVFFWSLSTNSTFLKINSTTGVLSGIPRNGDVGIWFVNVTLSDSKGGLDHHNFTLTVHNTNDDPSILTIPKDETMEDEEFFIQFVAVDIDPTNDNLYWTLTTPAFWLRIDQNTGNLTGIPSNSHVGDWNVVVTVLDGKGGMDTKGFTLTVINVNDDPIIDMDRTYIGDEDELCKIECIATDEDPTNDVLEWSMVTEASFLSIDPSTGIISGIPANDDVGEWTLEVKVSDTNGGSAVITLAIFVKNVNDAPQIITSSLPNAIEDELYQVILDGFDIDPTNDTLNWILQKTNCPFLSLDPSTGTLSFVPTNDLVGQWWVNIILSDGKGGEDSVNLTLLVENRNDSPEILTTDIGPIWEDVEFEFQMEGNDEDPTQDTLAWSLVTSADFLLLDSDTGELTGNPKNDDVGTWLLTITLSDGEGGTDVININLTVLNTNDIPVVNSSKVHISGLEDGMNLSYDISLNVFDVDGDRLSIEFSSDDNVTPEVSDLMVIFHPKQDWSGSSLVLFTISDGLENVNFSLELTIEPMPDPPFELNINHNLSYFVGSDQWVTGAASDKDLDYDDVLTFVWYSNISGKIGEGESINLSLPVGVHLVTLNVTDSFGLSAERSVEITILAIEPEPSNKGGGFPVWLVILLIIILIAIGGSIVLFFMKRKKEDNGPKKEDGSPVKGPQ